MKLSELLKGKTFPVKVRFDDWPWDDYLNVIGPDPDSAGHYVGRMPLNTHFHSLGGTSDKWELYADPPKKKKLYAYLVKASFNNWYLEFLEDESPQEFPYSKKFMEPENFRRTQQFDCEVDE